MTDSASDNQKDDPEFTNQRLVRAARSFEAILGSQIEIQSKLGDDLKSGIRVGMVVLGLIAVSILILLLTLSSQINRISDVVGDMNTNFNTVTLQMDRMSISIDSMTQQVALLELMDKQMQVMDSEMQNMLGDMLVLKSTIGNIRSHVAGMRHNVSNMSISMDHVNNEVQLMSLDMGHMSQPARSINKIFPMMP
ncbi:MAG: translation initiation factor 2 [Bacteroidetes bacterium]|nr:translation initiation factor 2 [Bacteroidota bacterium]